jgi:hypothetical protein
MCTTKIQEINELDVFFDDGQGGVFIRACGLRLRPARNPGTLHTSQKGSASIGFPPNPHICTTSPQRPHPRASEKWIETKIQSGMNSLGYCCIMIANILCRNDVTSQMGGIFRWFEIIWSEHLVIPCHPEQQQASTLGPNDRRLL